MDRPQAAERAISVMDDLDAPIRDIRTVIFSLHPRGGQDQPSMRAQITQLVQETAGALGMSAALRLDSHIPLGVGEDPMHTLREALSNAASHGQATQVEVSVEAGSDLALVV